MIKNSTKKHRISFISESVKSDIILFFSPKNYFFSLSFYHFLRNYQLDLMLENSESVTLNLFYSSKRKLYLEKNHHIFQLSNNYEVIQWLSIYFYQKIIIQR